MAFLSTLHNRHQTLEDLRSDLRSRSQEVSKELLDLVNSNYRNLLSLGTSLHGGAGKIDELRVGLLKFQKGLEAVRSVVETRERDVKVLIDERCALRKQIGLGRTLVAFDAMIEDLEVRLMIGTAGSPPNPGPDPSDDESDSEDGSDEDDAAQGSVGHGLEPARTRRLARRVQDYLDITQLRSTLDAAHPFVVAQGPRVSLIRQTLLLDLSTALRQLQDQRETAPEQLIHLMDLFGRLDASPEAVRIFQAGRIR